jgi:hypothetical protein
MARLYTICQIIYAEYSMSNVDQRFAKSRMDSLASLGFSVGSTHGVVRVEKYGCCAARIPTNDSK